MKKTIALIFAIFSWLKSFGKKYIYFLGKNNICDIDKKSKFKNCHIALVGENNIVKINKNANCNNLNIRIKGQNNSITIDENFTTEGITKIRVTGFGNKLHIGKNVYVRENLIIYNHDNGNNCLIEIGDKTTFGKTSLTTYENDSKIIIGKDCMFAYNTTIYNTDGHAIFQDEKIINSAKSTILGDHCWVAAFATILKNSFIPSGCIVGRGALVCGKFTQENAALGGVPARVIKSNVQWDRKTINQTLSEKLEKIPLGGG